MGMKGQIKIILIIASMLIWGLSYPLVKILLDLGVPPIILATLRHLVFIPMLVIFILRRSYQRYSVKDMRFFLSLAFFTIFLPNVTQNIGMMYTSASISSVIQSTSPVFTLILAFIFLREKKTINKIMGSILALLGTFFLSTGGRLCYNLSIFGNTLILISSISYAISGVILKKGLSRIPAFDLLCLETTFGFFMLLPVGLAFEGFDQLLNFNFEIWLYILILSLFASFIAAIIYYRVLLEEELSSLIMFTYLIPVFAIGFSYVLLEEVMSPNEILFTIIIILGVIISQLRSKTFGT